jgi:translation initiation factor 6 (eIF-6)
MLSRLFWIGLAGLALIGGMVLQSGGGIFSWGDHREISAKVDESIEDRVDRAIDRSFAETKRAMADAIGRLVKAEANLALVKATDGSDEELAAVQAQRNKARADVDRLESQIRALDRAASGDSDATREQIKREVREDVRASVKEAVGS